MNKNKHINSSFNVSSRDLNNFQTWLKCRFLTKNNDEI